MDEQPMPKPGRFDVPARTAREFVEVLIRQDAKGRAKYGTSLLAFNGRDAGQDAFEELVDCAQYLTQLRIEHAAYLSLLREIREAIEHRSWTDAEVIRAIDTALGEVPRD